MGCCSSKPNTTSIAQNSRLQDERRFQNKAGNKLSEEIANKERKEQPEEKLGFKKKELFVIQHRRSNDRRSDPKASSSESDGSMQPANQETPAIASNIMAMAAKGAAVRTSSCTKEEVDAILIQCGRLSRSSSGSARKYSGSKRSHDFDRENEISTDLNCDNHGDIDDDERQTRRHSRGSHRRRTPSRSRERDPQSQRSGSRERAAASTTGSRRVSRSPGRRSKSPVTKSGNLGNSANNSGITVTSNSNGAIRPGKMISVPATVSIEKNSNNNNGDCNVKRVLVKRNVGEGLAASRGGTPPRSRSPASRSNGVDASGGKEASLSRSNSRKAEHSPFRRTPLNEIDMGFLPFQPLADRTNSVKGQYKCNEIEEVVDKQPLVTQDKLGIDVNYPKVAAQGCSSSRGPEVKEIAQINCCRVNENQQSIMNFDEDKREQLKANGSTQSRSDTTKSPLTLTRSRSSRRSRDLDINVEALMNTTPATNYNLLLLQDIQNFHQKTSASTSVSDTNPNANTPIAKTPFLLPERLSKVSSIVEAVADLNSSTKPNNSLTCARNDTGNLSYVTSSVDGKKRLERPSIPFEEDDDDDVTEPSMHKYVTVRKRGSGFESFQGGDFDELESSGSNSYTSGSRHQCFSSSSWEPNSVDSTDRWTSRSREGVSPVTLDTHAFSSNRGRELVESSIPVMNDNGCLLPFRLHSSCISRQQSNKGEFLLISTSYPKSEANIGVKKVSELSFVRLPEMHHGFINLSCNVTRIELTETPTEARIMIKQGNGEERKTTDNHVLE
ncbi:hypothetical protein V2J09_001178 [Rumex salicifolius]